jgi:hypothetical protein
MSTIVRVGGLLTIAASELVVQNEGAALASRSQLNFIGRQITAVDNPNSVRTDVTVHDETLVHAVGDSGTALTLDAASANGWIKTVTLTGNCTFTLSGAATGRTTRLEIVLTQDPTGSRTVTWPSSVRWPSGTAPTLSTTPGATDRILLVNYNNSSAWLGEVLGLSYPPAPVSFRSASQNVATYVSTVAASAPAGMQVGDQLLAILVQDSSAAVDPSTSMTPPSGFGNETLYSITGLPKIKVWRKQAGSSEPSTYTFGKHASFTGACAVLAVSGVNGAAPYAVTPVGSNGGNEVFTTSHAVTGVSPTTANTLLVVISASAGAGVTHTPPGGMTERVDTLADATFGVSLSVNTELRSAAGATGSRTITTSAATEWAGLALALAPGDPVTETFTRPFFNTADWMWDPIITSPVLQTNSTAIVAALSDSGQQRACAVEDFAAKLVHASEVTAATPRYDIAFLHANGVSPTDEDWGPDPFGLHTMPIPDGTELLIPPGGFGWVDGHVSVADPTSNIVFNLWQATASGSPTRIRGASWGGIAALDGDGREFGGSSTGAGLARYGCVVRESEIAAGEIKHALFFATNMATVGNPSLPSTYRYPATKTDGSNASTSSVTIDEGTRVQLDPTINLAAIPGITQVELIVGRALQLYGAYCGDNATGSTRMGFVFEYKPGSSVYSAAGLFDYFNMIHIPWENLRVLRRWDGT